MDSYVKSLKLWCHYLVLQLSSIYIVIDLSLISYWKEWRLFSQQEIESGSICDNGSSNESVETKKRVRI